MGNNTVSPNRRKRRQARLITDPKKIFEITGVWADDPIPRCTLCEGVTIGLYKLSSTKPRQKEEARKCENCDIIFPLIKKTVVIETYDYQ